MAVKGIGSNYLYPVQNDYTTDSKTENTKNAVPQTTMQKEGVSYEKTICYNTAIYRLFISNE